MQNRFFKGDVISRFSSSAQGSPSATFNNDALKKSVANRPERHSVHA